MLKSPEFAAFMGRLGETLTAEGPFRTTSATVSLWREGEWAALGYTDGSENHCRILMTTGKCADGAAIRSELHKHVSLEDASGWPEFAALLAAFFPTVKAAELRDWKSVTIKVQEGQLPTLDARG